MDDATVEEFEIDLSELDNDELIEFEALLVAEYTAKRSNQDFGPDDVAEVRQIADVIKAVRAEGVARMELAAEDEAIEDDAEFGAFAQYVQELEAEFEDAESADEDTAEIEEEFELDEAAPAPIKDKGVNIIISPTGIEGDKPQATTRGGSIIASADIRGFRAGQQLSDLKDVAAAFIAKRPDVRGTDRGHDGATFLVASINNEYPEDRVLSMDLDANMAKIQAVKAPALTASGGLCAPLQPLYELQVWGDAHRPVRDALPGFKAERGGIRFMPAPVLSDVSGSTRVTTAAQDASGYTNQSPAGNTAPKPSIHVTCPTEQTKKIDAYSRSLTFGNMSARTYPEQVEAWLKLGMSEFARYTEVALLDAISTASTAMTAAQVYGLTYSLLEQVALTVTSFRARHRSPNATMRALFPFWVKEVIRVDLAGQGPGDGFGRYAVTDAQIDDWFRSRNVVPVWYQDNTTAAGAPFTTPSAGALQTWPTTAVWFVFPEGQFLYLDGGALDLGLVRDSTLNSQNDYQIFYEEFFGLASVGVQSLKVTSTICPTGTYAPAATARTCS